MAFFVDTSLSYMKKIQLQGIVEDNIKIIIKENIRDEKKIINVIKSNDEKIDVDVKINDDKLKMNIVKTNKTIFGNIFNLSIYKLEYNYCVSYINQDFLEINEC